MTSDRDHRDSSSPTGVGAAPVQSADFAALTLGVLTTLALYGYRFGEGNHTIYLLDAIRRNDPAALANDWFLTHTLQYHSVFAILAAPLMRWQIIEPVFAAIYVLLVAAMHFAWLGIARQLGGGTASYLVSIALYYLSAGGTGLGMYQFLQDSSVLPSNVANVALLWALLLWIRGNVLGSGVCFGLAGLLHLNHAVVGPCLWVALLILSRRMRHRILLASALALVPSAVNVTIAAAKITPGGSLDLNHFVDLYVRLRHPHHYDPSSWPAWLWLAFAWPIPLALLFLHHRCDAAAIRLRQVLLLLMMLQIIALAAAGVFYLSESLVQMSLYRFSVFVQLIACIAAANWLTLRIRTPVAAWVAAGICGTIAVICLIRGPFLGALKMPTDSREYLTLCDWAREHTPPDAIFLVPPGEFAFRLRARRAIVVNFKAVPQLSRELLEWERRLKCVASLDDLRALPRGYGRTFAALNNRYRMLASSALIESARLFGARYIVTERRIESLSPVYRSGNGSYFIYDLGRAGWPYGNSIDTY
jgi:hypothetical protein